MRRGALLKVLTTLEEMGARKAGGQVRTPVTDGQTSTSAQAPDGRGAEWGWEVCRPAFCSRGGVRWERGRAKA